MTPAFIYFLIEKQLFCHIKISATLLTTYLFSLSLAYLVCGKNIIVSSKLCTVVPQGWGVSKSPRFLRHGYECTQLVVFIYVKESFEFTQPFYIQTDSRAGDYRYSYANCRFPTTVLYYENIQSYKTPANIPLVTTQHS